MYLFYILSLFLFLVITPGQSLPHKSRELIGSEKCSWGPSYWCDNLYSAKSCNAVHHCVENYWEHRTYPEDNDDVCTICKNMVQQARDQLESNETMDELRQVFEGTCKLIYLKPVVTECVKLADEFVPELVETLSSQMNPGVVCSLAGLCNNATIDHMIADYKKSQPSNDPSTKQVQECGGCNSLVTKLAKRFNGLGKGDIMENFLEVCGRMGSFSDSCANIVIDHFNILYNHLKTNFKPKSFCHFTGVCSFQYHTHESKTKSVEIMPKSKVGVVKIADSSFSEKILPSKQPEVEDEECDMCAQLVTYLRNILVANTTENEFERVMEGICKQTGKFKAQCLAIVDEYYRQIYGFLVDDLNGKTVCSLVGICPRPQYYFDKYPLLLEPAKKVKQEISYGDKPIDTEKAQLPVIRIQTPQFSMKKEISYGDVPTDVQAFQLPLERFHSPQKTMVNVENKEICLFCEYFLHYVQQFVSQPQEEENLKNIVFNACDHLPKSVSGQCKSFVNLYGNAFVAILVEEIDPSEVCPSLNLCPAKPSKGVEIIDVTGAPSCPLCLLAMDELDKKLKDNKTEANVRNALDSLCVKLPSKLIKQCEDLVDQYTEQLVDMIIADFTPQEICVYLRLCPASEAVDQPSSVQHYEIMTNEISEDFHVDDSEPSTIELKKDSTVCVICEFVMSKLDNDLKQNATEEEIEDAVMNICRHLPKTVSSTCLDFVKEYSDAVIEILVQTLDPKVACQQLKLCQPNNIKAILENMHQVVQECAVCEATVGALTGILEDKDVDRDISTLVEKVCPALPIKAQGQCHGIIRIYGPQIISLIVDMGMRPSVVCWKLHLCDEATQSKVKLISTQGDKVDMDMIKIEEAAKPHLIGGNRCTWGPSYWCQSEDHANSCGTINHCREKIWKSDKPDNN